MVVKVRMYDKSLTPRGILPVIGGTAVLRNSNVSTFSLDFDDANAITNRFTTGWHIAIEDDGVQLLTGQPDKITVTAADGVTTVTASGQSHMRWVNDMITIPTPSTAADSQTEESNYVAKGAAGTLVYNLLRTHIGQNARSENKRPITILTGDPGVTTSISSRFQNLLDEVRAILGDLRVRTFMESGQIYLAIEAVRDLTRSVRLSEASGGLTGYTYELSAPTVTRVLVAGQGVGTDRTLTLHTGNANDWGVDVLQFQDRRDTDDADELEKAGTETLTEGQEQASITLETAETSKRFGVDFTLGDKITAVLADGVNFQDTLQSAEITWGETGREVKLQIGPTQDEIDAPAWVSKIHDLRTQLRRLQAV